MGVEYNRTLEKLKRDIEEKSKDVEDCKKMFAELFKITDFDKYRDQINAVLAINARYEGKELPQEIIRKFSVKKDGRMSVEELTSICQQYSDLAKPSQEKLIVIANRALSVAKQVSNTTPLTREEKEYVLLSQEYKKILVKQMKEKYRDKFIPINYISTINKIANERALSTIEFCRERQIAIDSYNVLDEVMCKVNNCGRIPREEIKVKGVEKLIKKIETNIALDDKVQKISTKR